MQKVVNALREKHRKGKSGAFLLLSAYEKALDSSEYGVRQLRDNFNVLEVIVIMECEL